MGGDVKKQLGNVSVLATTEIVLYVLLLQFMFNFIASVSSNPANGI